MSKISWVISDGRLEKCYAKDPKQCRNHRDKNGKPMRHWTDKNAAVAWLEDHDKTDPPVMKTLRTPASQEMSSARALISMRLIRMVRDHHRSGEPLIFEPIWRPSADSIMRRPEWWSDVRSVSSDGELDRMGLYSGGLEQIASWSEGISKDSTIIHKTVSVGIYDAIRNEDITWNDLRKEGVKTAYAEAWSDAVLNLSASMKPALAWIGRKPKIFDHQDAQHPEWVISPEGMILSRLGSSRSLQSMLSDIDRLSYNLKLLDTCRLKIVFTF
jgi:hypothetical protein